ncbi:MAG: PD-(D/E)XK nuclease family protein [Acidimicrobiia bacterium]|nr:PD-(D/E)XK nuclease family protein [Acidimicrobiia bacterium]
MATVEELTVAGPGPDHPGVGVVLDLRTWLEAELRAITEPWSGPGGPLGITKNRVLAAARCPASVLAEADDLPLSAPLVIGSVVDMAASMLLVSDKVPGTAPWLGALMPVLHQTDPDQAAFIESLSVEARQELRDLVQEKGERLARLLGDVRSIPGTAQEMFRVELSGAGVSLSGRADLVLGRGARTVVEVKSGAVRAAHVDEAGFYALLGALRDGVAPASTVVVTLDPGAVTEYPVTVDSLEASAQRVLTTAGVLVEVDRAVTARAWPVTSPSDFCVWCGVVQRCPDAPDLARAEAESVVELREPDDRDLEPW